MARPIRRLSHLAATIVLGAAPGFATTDAPRRIAPTAAIVADADALDRAALQRSDWSALSARASESAMQAPTVERLARAVVLARLAGDQASLEAHAAALSDLAAGTPAVGRAATALVLADRTEDAARLLLDAGQSAAAARLLAEEVRPAEALVALEGAPSFADAAEAARLHATLGEPEAAARVLLHAVELTASRPPQAVVRELARLGLDDAARALAVGHLEAGGPTRPLLQALHPTAGSEACAVVNWLERVAPHDQPAVRLARLDAMLARGTRPEALADFVAWSLAQGHGLGDCAAAAHFDGAVRLAQRHGDADAALTLARQHARALPSARSWQALGDLLGRRGAWVEAAEAHAQAATLAPSDPVAAGLAAAAARRVPESARDRVAPTRSPGTDGLDADQRLRLAWALEAQAGGEGAGSEASDAARDLRLSVLADGASGSAVAMAAAQSLASRASCERAWPEAAGRWERVRLELLLREPSLTTDLVAPALRSARTASLEAAVAQERWDDALALASGGLSAPLARLDATAALVRGLENAGRTEDADALFTRVFDRLDVAAREFPSSAPLLNSLAWLCARTGREPARGLGAAEAAVLLAPRSSAILDTLAEARLQAGDRAGAVEAAAAALALDPSRPYLRAQLARITAGDAASAPPLELE